ncbi:hypothetical protein KCP76_06150 [Salmonella enterica subsp. enterica serovar Weltevreden]|nr:hypothetical protein KCP76_06150 [Salmonella enterica subsp. enterica serovar Weltevreden]
MIKLPGIWGWIITVARCCRKWHVWGRRRRFIFPRPMTDRPKGWMQFFPGLKTFAANTIRSSSDDEQTRADIARF